MERHGYLSEDPCVCQAIAVWREEWKVYYTTGSVHKPWLLSFNIALRFYSCFILDEGKDTQTCLQLLNQPMLSSGLRMFYLAAWPDWIIVFLPA